MQTIHKAMPRRKATRATRSLALEFGTDHAAKVHNPQNLSRKPIKADKTARKFLICPVIPLATQVGRRYGRYHSGKSCPGEGARTDKIDKTGFFIVSQT
jgi:hypothetical protein